MHTVDNIITAYRGYYLFEGPKGSIYLRGQHRALWPHATLVAQCTAPPIADPTSPGPQTVAERVKQARKHLRFFQHEKCGCGIYGMWKREKLDDNVQVIAQCAFYGLVVLASDGLQAEKARILSLEVLRCRLHEEERQILNILVHDLEKRYQVPVSVNTEEIPHIPKSLNIPSLGKAVDNYRKGLQAFLGIDDKDADMRAEKYKTAMKRWAQEIVAYL